MRIYWLGHSCFHIVDSKGLSIVTDPFDESIGYRMPKLRADVALISHEHYDHNNVEALQGNPVVLRGPGRHIVEGREFLGVASHHDERGGRLRGPNTIFCFVVDGFRICHLGDLGHQLSERAKAEIGEVDLLMIPVGGIFTLDGPGASQVVKELCPRIIIPMHYNTEALTFELEAVDRFLEGKDVEGPEKFLSITSKDLDMHRSKVVLLDYHGSDR
ncbi:MAG: MBL fold metallo-hydrolase [Methanotrichaceae archaeon]|nr:MBL fold metallo-hydrolase [Methanotrichaceae archaeon]